MNSSEFADMLPAECRPHYEAFRGYQRLAIETLREFHRVCEKRGVEYQLAWGSLLGAVRDNGQIPWDYDVDVFVRCDQREELIDALRAELSSRYYFTSIESESSCRNYIMRLAPEGYDSSALHVDVFFLMGTSADEATQKDHLRRMHAVAESRFRKLVNARKEAMGKPEAFLKMILKKLLLLTTSVRSLDREYLRLIGEYPLDSALYWAEADSFAEQGCFSRDLLNETELIETELGVFRVSKSREKLLSEMYGEYMNYAPLDQRIEEFERHYKKLVAFNG